MSIAICAIAKNECKNLDEWIEYHLSIGVDKIYLYDNESSDDSCHILNQYPQVYSFIIQGKTKQLDAYNDCLQNFGYNHEWIGFIDIDEFVIPMINSSLRGILDKYKDYGGLGINWAIYGSSNHDDRPKGNIKDNYLYRSGIDFGANLHIKSFVQPSRVIEMASPHNATYNDGFYCVDEKFRRIDGAYTDSVTWDSIRINHYYCKSREDYKDKISRGRADHPIAEYNFESFNDHDKNDIYDDILKGR